MVTKPTAVDQPVREERYVFLSYGSGHAFEAELLQFALESLLIETKTSVWTYQRDQKRDENAVARLLKEKVKGARGLVFLVTPSTVAGGATQWMELAYADAFGVPTFVLLHQMTFEKLKEGAVPPLLLAAQCNSTDRWRLVAADLKERCR